MDSEKKRQMTAGAMFSYFSIAFKILSVIIYTPIILHSLGQSEYGIYSLCTSFIGYLTLLNGGMNAAYVRFYVQAKEKRDYDLNGINGIFLKIFFALGLIGMLTGLLISTNTEVLFGNRIHPGEYEVFRKTLRILSATILVSSVNGVFSSGIVAHEKFIVGKFVDLAHTILVPVATVPFLLSGYGAVAVVAVNLTLAVLMLVVNSAYAVRRLGMKFDLKRTDKAFLKAISVFAGFIALQAVMDQLNWQVDKLILARVRGSGEVAVYSVGSIFNGYFITIGGALAGVFIAEINQLAARGNDEALSGLFVRMSRIFAQIAVLMMSGFIVFGKPFIERWAGLEYADSYYIGLLIMLPVTFTISQGLGQDIARAKNMHKIQILINVAVCFLNFLVSIPLAMRFGAIGSAVGTFACEIVICIIVQSVYYQKMVRIDMRAYYREMFRLLPGWILPFLLGAALIYFKRVRSSYVSILLYGALYVAVFVASVWRIDLSDGEKRYIRKLVEKLIKGRK